MGKAHDQKNPDRGYPLKGKPQTSRTEVRAKLSKGMQMGKTMPSNRLPAKVSERQLMLRAINLARKCRSEPLKVSPKVGAVIPRDGRTLGEAFRGELAPGEHAEFTLLEKN